MDREAEEDSDCTRQQILSRVDTSSEALQSDTSTQVRLRNEGRGDILEGEGPALTPCEARHAKIWKGGCQEASHATRFLHCCRERGLGKNVLNGNTTSQHPKPCITTRECTFLVNSRHSHKKTGTQNSWSTPTKHGGGRMQLGWLLLEYFADCSL